MTAPQPDTHSKNVEEWFQAKGRDLSLPQQLRLLEKAIRAIEERACQTLSKITLMVVLDRVLHLSRQKYPVLADVTLEKHLLDFTSLNKNNKSEDAVAALNFLLIELLRILGRLTANILTKPLHTELKKVTANDSGES